MYFYEIVTKYQRKTGEDNPGLVKETYLVEAINPTNAEARVIDEIKPFIFGDHETERITKRNIYDIFANPNGENWYKGRVELIVVDGDTESRKAFTVLVQANTISDALRTLQDETGSIDCEIVGLAKSAILEVYRGTNDVKE